MPPALRRVGHVLWRWFFGPAAQAPLTITHCVHSAAETFFTVSMAGSIFFSVSPDAARPRVLLFLVLTLAPFLVMAPLIGPLVDRVRGGLPTTMIVTFAIRAALALLLAENLRTLLLFPLAFGILVVAKTYTVSRNVLVPAVVDDLHDLVAANSRLSRSATFAGALAAAAAVAVYAATSAAATLRVGAAVYVIGMVAAWRVRRVARPLAPVDNDAAVELVRPDVSGAVWDMMALRAAIGFAVFHFGFSLRAGGESAWLLGRRARGERQRWVHRHGRQPGAAASPERAVDVHRRARRRGDRHGGVRHRVQPRHPRSARCSCWVWPSAWAGAPSTPRSSVSRRTPGGARCTPASRRASSWCGCSPRASRSPCGWRRGSASSPSRRSSRSSQLPTYDRTWFMGVRAAARCGVARRPVADASRDARRARLPRRGGDPRPRRDRGRTLADRARGRGHRRHRDRRPGRDHASTPGDRRHARPGTQSGMAWQSMRCGDGVRVLGRRRMRWVCGGEIPGPGLLSRTSVR